MLDELEWYAEEEPTAVEVDLGEYRQAFLGRCAPQEDAEQRHAESTPEGAEAVGDRARETAARIAHLIRYVEETEVAPVDRGCGVSGSSI